MLPVKGKKQVLELTGGQARPVGASQADGSPAGKWPDRSGHLIWRGRAVLLGFPPCVPPVCLARCWPAGGHQQGLPALTLGLTRCSHGGPPRSYSQPLLLTSKSFSLLVWRLTAASIRAGTWKCLHSERAEGRKALGAPGSYCHPQ